MNWDKLISTKRIGQQTEPQNSIRTEFQKDYDRLIFSSPFRRLQNKTQVFPLPGKVFVHNRLTHSLEVASVGRSLGNIVADKLFNEKRANEKILETGAIVSAACLAHDMGNPPFGHSGEESISTFFVKNEAKFKNLVGEKEWCDFINFDGNANAFHLLTHQFKGRREGGYRLTYSTLASIVKYPYESIDAPKKNKFGFFQCDKNAYLDIADQLGLRSNDGIIHRHPFVYLVEAADDICYQIMDFEDAHKLGILSFAKVKDSFISFFENDKQKLDSIAKTLSFVDDKNEQISYLRALIINKLIFLVSDVFTNHVDEIIQGNFKTSLIESIPDQYQIAFTNIQKTAISTIYKHRSVVEIEISGYKIIGNLLDEFVNAIIDPKNSYSKKILSLIPEQYQSKSGDIYKGFLSVTDFISGMTDLYALDLYRNIKGISTPSI